MSLFIPHIYFTFFEQTLDYFTSTLRNVSTHNKHVVSDKNKDLSKH